MITLIVADSLVAARIFSDASVDWVHLDARHDYAGLAADIQGWLRKSNLVGWLTGDDYDEVKWPEVVKVVSNLLPGAMAWSTRQWRWLVS